MKRLSENKLILVIRETRLDELIARYNTLEQARFYIEHLGADFSDYLLEDRRYKSAIAAAETALHRLGRVQVVRRHFLPSFVFGDDDVVVVLGQDGLVANTLKYLDQQPVLGVNPDPGRWDGALLPFAIPDLPEILPDVFSGRYRATRVTMAKAELTDGQVLHAVNDLFIGAKTHVSARYLIHSGPSEEEQSSSGIIVSTGLGSTGWLRSVITGAIQLAGSVNDQRLATLRDRGFARDANHLYFSVREPFPSKATSTSIVFGRVTESQPLRLESRMAGNGVIFSDGVEADFLAFNSGAQATITVSDRHGCLVKR